MNTNIIIKPRHIDNIENFDYTEDGIEKHEYAIYTGDKQIGRYEYITQNSKLVKTWKTKRGAIQWYEKHVTGGVLVDRTKD